MQEGVLKLKRRILIGLVIAGMLISIASQGMAYITGGSRVSNTAYYWINEYYMTAQMRDTIALSGSTWNGVANFTFARLPSTTSTWDYVSFTPADTPGVTTHIWDSTGTKIVDSFSKLNQYWTWNYSGNFNQANREADVQTVATHEFGHWLRLLHDSAHLEAVMWPDFTQKWSLRQDDIDGIIKIYGAPIR